MIINKIKQLMVFYGYTQKSLAKKLNMSEVLISRYLNGKRILTIDFIIAVSELFDVSIDWLLKDGTKTR